MDLLTVNLNAPFACSTVPFDLRYIPFIRYYRIIRIDILSTVLKDRVPDTENTGRLVEMSGPEYVVRSVIAFGDVNVGAICEGFCLQDRVEPDVSRINRSAEDVISVSIPGQITIGIDLQALNAPIRWCSGHS